MIRALPSREPLTGRFTIEPMRGPGWQAMVALRHRVLRAPLGLRFSDAQLEAEGAQIHLALWLGTRLAGTLLLIPPDAAGEGKLRQMAIEPELQRAGLGTSLVRRGENELRRLGSLHALLSARETAVGFYGRLGYVVEGDSFVEVTLPHRLMRRRLEAGAISG